MKIIVVYISYIMGILGFAGIVWTYATKTATKDFDVASLRKEVVEMKKDMVTKYELRILIDSLQHYNYRVEQKMNTVVKSNNNLRNSYVKFINKAVDDKQYWLELMEGIEWVVSPIEDKRTNIVDSFKIKIQKKR